MWELIKTGLEVLKNWRENGAALYGLLCELAAVLVVISLMTAERPITLVADLATAWHLPDAAHWLTEVAAPTMAGYGPGMQDDVLHLLFGWLSVMLLVPLWRGRHSRSPFFQSEFEGLVGSRSASTVWLFLFLAVQQGPLQKPLSEWGAALTSGVLGLIPWIIGAVLVYWAARKIGLQLLLDPLVRFIGTVIHRIWVGITTITVAVFLVAIYLPMSCLGWLAALQPDRRRNEPGQTVSQAG